MSKHGPRFKSHFSQWEFEKSDRLWTGFNIVVRTGLETGFCFVVDNKGMVANKGCYGYYVNNNDKA